jgi:outer membrane receptor protein involved in Fe transport
MLKLKLSNIQLSFVFVIILNLKFMKKILLLFVLMLFTGSLVMAQTVMITGTVTSQEDGAAVPGANVSVKGTTIGAITDAEGKYQISVPASAKTLVISYIGMESQEIEIEGKNKIEIVMKPDILLVDEVIVVAYGTTKREAFTGSASSVRVDKLAEIQVSNVTKALEGLSSGIQVTSGSGQPGTTTAVRIRGIGSINASTAPLYVVDGFPFDGDLNSSE